MEIGCPRTAAALALDIAEQLAAERQVLLVDDLSRRHLRRAGRNAPDQVEIVDRADLTGRRALLGPNRELVLRAGSVGPGTTWVDLAEFGRDALLVVRAGRVSAPWLHTVARQLAHAGITPIGVMVAPHPQDHTDGAVWEALHAAIQTVSQRNGAVPHELSRSILSGEWGGGLVNVALFGLGYVGSVTAAGLAARGHHLVGVDTDPGKVLALNQGRAPVIEPGLDELVGQAIASGALRATGSVTDVLASAEPSLVCVGTPSTITGGTDLAQVSRVVTEIGTALAGAQSLPNAQTCRSPCARSSFARARAWRTSSPHRSW